MFQQNNENRTGRKRTIDITGFLMVVIPLISALVLWCSFYNFDALKNIRLYYFIITSGTVLVTTVIATVDSHRTGLKVRIYKRKEIYGGSFLKFFVFLLLWPYAYPVYLYRRKNYGGRNLLVPVLFSMLVLIVSSVYLYIAIENRSVEEEAYRRRVMRHSR